MTPLITHLASLEKEKNYSQCNFNASSKFTTVLQDGYLSSTVAKKVAKSSSLNFFWYNFHNFREILGVKKKFVYKEDDTFRIK